MFSVLKELVQVVPNSLTGHTSLVIPGIQKALLVRIWPPLPKGRGTEGKGEGKAKARVEGRVGK